MVCLRGGWVCSAFTCDIAIRSHRVWPRWHCVLGGPVAGTAGALRSRRGGKANGLVAQWRLIIPRTGRNYETMPRVRLRGGGLRTPLSVEVLIRSHRSGRSWGRVLGGLVAGTMGASISPEWEGQRSGCARAAPDSPPWERMRNEAIGHGRVRAVPLAAWW